MLSLWTDDTETAKSDGTILDVAQLDALSPPLVSIEDCKGELRQQVIEEGDVAVGIRPIKSTLSNEMFTGGSLQIQRINSM